MHWRFHESKTRQSKLHCSGWHVKPLGDSPKIVNSFVDENLHYPFTRHEQGDGEVVANLFPAVVVALPVNRWVEKVRERSIDDVL